MTVVFQSTTPNQIIFNGASVYKVTFAGFIGVPQSDVDVSEIEERLSALESAGGGRVSYNAGESISTGMAVVKQGAQVFKFDINDPSHAGRPVGIAATSGTLGQIVEIQRGGTITDGAFSFSTDMPVFIGANSFLTTTPPSLGMIQPAGLSISATSMIIDFNSPSVRI